MGKKQAGKDTVGNYLINNYSYAKVSFADPLRAICKKYFLLTDEELLDPTLKETKNDKINGFTPRQLMQELGTDWFRKYDDNIWIRLAQKQTEEHLNVVFTDVRFSNEANICDYTIRVLRPEKYTRKLTIWDILRGKKDPSKHISENALNDYKADFTIVNIENDFKGLYKQVDAVAKKIKGDRCK
jgi:hypothetical protein